MIYKASTAKQLHNVHTIVKFSLKELPASDLLKRNYDCVLHIPNYIHISNMIQVLDSWNPAVDKLHKVCLRILVFAASTLPLSFTAQRLTTPKEINHVRRIETPIINKLLEFSLASI